MLYLLLWTCERLMRPTFRNLTESWESWAYRNGLLRQLNRLASQKLVESHKSENRKCPPLWRLSEAGRIHALGGRDPVKEWLRPWDGRWRLVTFDIPVQCNLARDRIRLRLRNRGFGLLQESVWITPHGLPTVSQWLPDPGENASLLFLQSEPVEGNTDQDVVSTAWDFARINELYACYMTILKNQPPGPIHDERGANMMRTWWNQERLSWLEAVTSDPLLPDPLLPAGYLGKEAWSARATALSAAANSWNHSPVVRTTNSPKKTRRTRRA